MEADWEVEIGPYAEVIDAYWDNLIDLRREPARITEIEEAHDFPALRSAILTLNAPHGQLWTSKCDLWIIEEIDPYEMEAAVDEALFGYACYIDILPSICNVFPSSEEAIAFSRSVITRLKNIPLPRCRVDLIVRTTLASKAQEGYREGYGITAYLSACGANEIAAKIQLSALLAVFASTATLQ